MTLGKHFFDIAVYRIPEKQYYAEMSSWTEKRKDEMFDADGDYRKSFEANRNLVASVEDNLRRAYGGGWRYNEAIGFIRLHFLGSQIRGEYYAVDAKKIVKSRRKHFIYKTHKLAPEITVWPESSNSEIVGTLLQYVTDCQRELPRRYIDTEMLKAIAPFVDWHSLIGFAST